MIGNYNAEDVWDVTSLVRSKLNTLDKMADDREVIDVIEQTVFNDDKFAYRNYEINKQLVEAVFYSLREDLGILKPFLDDPSINEIMVNGKDSIFVENEHGIVLTDKGFFKIEELENIIRRIASSVHREFNELNPILDARLEDGSRVNAVYRNVALGGPSLTVRKFSKAPIRMDDLLRFGTITEEALKLLKACVRAGFNIFISGGTSSGKTTFLNCLTEYIPSAERIVVIEDSAELKIMDHENVVRLECRNDNSQGAGGITMTDLIRASLRMRPSRIIVGEVRGAEVYDMINACNTGHDGSISTGHGNSIDGMIKRLEAMYIQASDFPVSAIRSQISEGIDMIIHLQRMPDMSRKVVSIAEITGMKDGEISTQLLFNYDAEKGLVRTENRLSNVYKMQIRGEDYEGL